MHALSACENGGEWPMICTMLGITLALVLRVLVRLARMQSAGHLVISVKAARHGYKKKRKARGRSSTEWKLSSSVWELRFRWCRHRLGQCWGRQVAGGRFRGKRVPFEQGAGTTDQAHCGRGHQTGWPGDGRPLPVIPDNEGPVFD